MLVVVPMSTPSVGIFQHQGDPRARVAALHDSDSASTSSSVRCSNTPPSSNAAGDADGATKRPRRARCRWSASAKLPKMNNSERGKFYRKKYKDYELQLERDVLAMRARVRELSLLAELRRRLCDDLSVSDAGAAASATLERLDALKAGADAPDAPHVEWVGRYHRTPAHRNHNRNHTHGNHTHTHQRHAGSEHGDDQAPSSTPSTTTRFELSALHAAGCADAPVVAMVGRLRVFRSTAGASSASNPPAEEEEVAAYPCTYRLLFSADCAQHELLADVDVVQGLCGSLRRLDLVAHAARRVSEARTPSVTRADDRKDVTLVTASLASASLKGRLPGVHQLLRVAAQHSDGYSSAGTIGADSSPSSLGANYHDRRRRSVEAPARLMTMPAVKAEPRLEEAEDKRRWPLLLLGKRQRAMTMDYILS